MVATRTLVPLLLATLAALAAAHPDYSDTWEEFKQSYGKQYDSAEEEVTLFNLFIELNSPHLVESTFGHFQTSESTYIKTIND